MPSDSLITTVRQIRASYWSWRLRCEAAELALSVREGQLARLAARCREAGIYIEDLDQSKDSTNIHNNNRRFEWRKN